MRPVSKAASLFEDGTIDDLAGEGKWHIEKLRDNLFYLGSEINGEYVKFHIYADNGEIIVEPTTPAKLRSLLSESEDHDLRTIERESLENSGDEDV